HSQFDRRDFLKSMGAAAAAALAGGAPKSLRADEPAPKATADTCILLWMAGGMASPETFDPKRYTPFEVGVPANKILCTFPAIDAFLNIGQRLEGVGESEELKAFTTAGFLGSEYGPFNLPYPMDAVAAVRPPKGMTPERFANREKKFKELLKQSPMGDLASD